MESKPVYSIPPRPLLHFLPAGSCLRFLPWLPSMMWKLIGSFHLRLSLMFIPALALMSWTLTSESLISYRDNLHSFTENHSFFCVYLDWQPILCCLSSLRCSLCGWDLAFLLQMQAWFCQHSLQNHQSWASLAPWLWSERKDNNNTAFKKCRRCILTEASCSGVVDQPVTNTTVFVCVLLLSYSLKFIWGWLWFYFVFLALLLFLGWKELQVGGIRKDLGERKNTIKMYSNLKIVLNNKNYF